ncbi:uncharacterized protein LACBIDRAFT_327826 [Laccaria bicolor S238N-H82]|uniref:Predicted protein n=1 Tax=Laccaria bicolor (strain S238N-H82 / ATCC MYA-4686) TaxID=486041 RepID=B0DCY5_LACBS|nr:uncharacterized protein LACBIDRAFT_327826 [Laccaria bicolor S238N-H82]EDR07516.1 predicted protein [Laccaria bicolor S238N-H82]|eukprot:XP_001881908.1 predicted protein [Laccaria bicolor S238N-H82]
MRAVFGVACQWLGNGPAVMHALNKLKNLMATYETLNYLLRSGSPWVPATFAVTDGLTSCQRSTFEVAREPAHLHIPSVGDKQYYVEDIQIRLLRMPRVFLPLFTDPPSTTRKRTSKPEVMRDITLTSLHSNLTDLLRPVGIF